MTPEAQQIAIALARGWAYSCRGGWGMVDSLEGPEGQTEMPDYLNDLNACVDLIAFMELRGYSCVLFAKAGERRCSFIDAAYAVDFTVTADKFETAICEAFLKAMNLWRE